MTKQEAYRHVPYDIDIEQALLGSILRDNRAMDRASLLVKAEHFYDPLHGRIFETMGQMISRGGVVVTPLTLHASMKADPGIMETGGQAYLEAMYAAAPSIPNIRDFCNILADLYVRRSLINVGTEIVNSAYDAPMEKTALDQIADAERALYGVGHAAGQMTIRKLPQAASVVSREVIERAQRVMQGERIPQVTTGLLALDEAMGGMQGGDFIVLPGRSGMGKSALMGGISLRAAMAGYPSLCFSMEMKAHQWIERNITDLDFDTAVQPIPYQAFRKGTLTMEELARCEEAHMRIPDDNMLEICDDRQLNIHDIGARARAFKAKHPGKLGLIVVDYLQIIQPAPGKDRSREQEVTQLAVGLKSLAKALDWPVLAGAQLLTKGGDPKMANKERIPTLADIRESGGIETEADIIIAPHRKAFYLRKSKPDLPQDDPEYQIWRAEYRACKNAMKIYGLKNRMGAEFDLDLYCDMRSSSIRDEAPRIAMSSEERAARDLLDGL